MIWLYIFFLLSKVCSVIVILVSPPFGRSLWPSAWLAQSRGCCLGAIFITLWCIAIWKSMLQPFNLSSNRRDHWDFALSLPAAQKCHRNPRFWGNLVEILAKKHMYSTTNFAFKIKPQSRSRHGVSFAPQYSVKSVATVCKLEHQVAGVSQDPWLQHGSAYYLRLYEPRPPTLFEVHIDIRSLVLQTMTIAAVVYLVLLASVSVCLVLHDPKTVMF